MQKLYTDSPTACGLYVLIPTDPKPELQRHEARRVHMLVASLPFVPIIETMIKYEPPKNGSKHVHYKSVKPVSNVTRTWVKAGTGTGTGGNGRMRRS